MTLCRKKNIPVFLWFSFSTLYSEVLFICFMWVYSIILELIYGTTDYGLLWKFIKEDNYCYLWVTLLFFICLTISQLRSAVTKLTINQETEELTFCYYHEHYLFLKKKELTIPFSKLDYEIVNEKKLKFSKIISPFLPTKMFVFYRDNLFLLQFGCTLGWTSDQFNEIECELRDIASPRSDPKGFVS